MSSFTEPLEVRQINGEKWQTVRGFMYYHDTDKMRELYFVPVGFVTDFASIPRAAWPLIGHPAGEYAQAAVLHDFLYRVRKVSRRKADDIFLEAMEVLGVAKWKRVAMWCAVRAFGGLSW